MPKLKELVCVIMPKLTNLRVYHNAQIRRIEVVKRHYDTPSIFFKKGVLAHLHFSLKRRTNDTISFREPIALEASAFFRKDYNWLFHKNSLVSAFKASILHQEKPSPLLTDMERHSQ